MFCYYTEKKFYNKICNFQKEWIWILEYDTCMCLILPKEYIIWYLFIYRYIEMDWTIRNMSIHLYVTNFSLLWNKWILLLLIHSLLTNCTFGFITYSLQFFVLQHDDLVFPHFRFSDERLVVIKPTAKHHLLTKERRHIICKETNI